MDPSMAAPPAPTPAPIHDIVEVVSIFPYPLWMILVAGAGLLALLVLLVWWLFLRKKPLPPLSPKQKAIVAMNLLKKMSLSPYEFGIRISDVLRSYIDEAFGIRAVTATSIEFLESIRENPRFSPEEQVSLREFLETVDLIKFARVEADGPELAKLFVAAEAVVTKQEMKEST